MMKLCINALNLRNHLGGIGWYAYYLVKYLKKTNPSLEITILTHSGLAGQFNSLGRDVTVWVFHCRKLWIKVLYFQLCVPFLVKKQFDVLHSIGNIGMMVCPIPQIITICDTYEKVSPQRFGFAKRFLMGLMISISGRNAAAIITISKNTLKDIARFYPYLKNKSHLIYLGNKFEPEKQALYKPLPQFLFVGTIEPGKNLATVIKALAIVNALGKKSTLKVIGAPGWKQSALARLIEKLHSADQITFCGYTTDEQLKHEYQSSYALICASVYEGFGLPVIEALACGCPVICANNSALPEAGADCVVYFNAEDEYELSEKMLWVLNNPHKVQDNIRAGFLHAARFTWEKTAQETYELYQRVVLKKLRPSNAEFFDPSTGNSGSSLG